MTDVDGFLGALAGACIAIVVLLPPLAHAWRQAAHLGGAARVVFAVGFPLVFLATAAVAYAGWLYGLRPLIEPVDRWPVVLGLNLGVVCSFLSVGVPPTLASFAWWRAWGCRWRKAVG